MIRISVLYPSSEGKKFDVNYYVNNHMKLVRERLGSFGLERTEVDKGLAGGAPGARVLVLEKAPEAWRGCHGFFTSSGFRITFRSFEEVCGLVGNLSDEEKAWMNVPLYTEDNYYDDLMRVTADLGDADLALTL